LARKSAGISKAKRTPATMQKLKTNGADKTSTDGTFPVMSARKWGADDNAFAASTKGRTTKS
jgi:hypothetical protein